MLKISSLENECIHCGSLFSTSQASQNFCCGGCEFVYQMIQSKGLGHFYELRDMNPPVCAIPAQTSASQYEYCDDDEFIKKLSPDGIRMRFFLEGLNCTACLWLLEKLPDYCDDAETARINMGTSTIEVRRKASGSFSKIAQTLNRLGYRPYPLRETEASSHLQIQEKRRDLVRIGLAGAITGNIMILAVSIYGGATGVLAAEFRLLSGLLAVPVLTYCAWPFYQSSISALRTRRMNLDVPIVIAIFAGIATSFHGLFSIEGITYFDSLSMLVFLLLSSRFVLKNIQRRQLQSTNLEDELLLTSVMKLNSNGTSEITSSLSLLPGDKIKMDRESTIPVDGIVESGTGLINRSVMTGETELYQISKGSKVEAGCTNISGEWILVVTHAPAQTRLAQILRDTEKAATTKSSFVHFSERISNWFIFTVLSSAVLIVAFFLNSNLHEGISRALALIIVTCPCVFGIAIPLSMSFAIRGAARNGIVVKNADAIEKLWNIKTLFFDKTGTLTKGHMSVLEMTIGNIISRDLVLSIAGGLEENQIHPVARAITNYAKTQGAKNFEFENIKNLPDGGVASRLSGRNFSMRPLNLINRETSSKIIVSAYGLFLDDLLAAKFLLGDELRTETKSLISWARERHLDTQILSGDRSHVVESCAASLGILQGKFQANMTPEKKAEVIQSYQSNSLMVGDGANDAAALASASVGIAVCGSLDMSLRAADIYLTRPNLHSIRDIFEIANLTRSAIYRNLIFSASFNLISGFLAAAGYMKPLWAAVFMPLSSITILLSSVWTGRKFSRHLKTESLTK